MARRDRVIRLYCRERFVVTLLDGTTFDGLLDDHDESTLEFIDAHSVGQDPANGRISRTPVDGRLYLPRARVAYMQRPVSQ